MYEQEIQELKDDINAKETEIVAREEKIIKLKIGISMEKSIQNKLKNKFNKLSSDYEKNLIKLS